MHGDALGPEALDIQGGLGDIRHVPTPGVPQGGHLIYIDAESGHGLKLILYSTKIRKILRNVLILAFDLIRRYILKYENRILYPPGWTQERRAHALPLERP
jgi:hypothetical protein